MPFSITKELIDDVRRSARRHAPARDVEDIVQETLVILVKHSHRDDIDNLNAFARAVAGNVARSFWKRDPAVTGQSLSEIDDDAESVDDAVINRMSVRAKLDELPSEDRSLIVDLFWKGKPASEIARSEGVDFSTISRRTAKAIDRLRRLLGREFDS